MLQAEQRAIVQQTNFNIIEIRQLEVDYFLQVFTAFGTQAALIAGFTSRFDNTSGTRAPVFFVYIYWVFTTISFVTAMQVVLVSAFVSVFGQGLALHGPAGSMVKAIGGMVSEIEQVIFLFTISVCTFTLASVGTHWIKFSLSGAILCNIIVVIGVSTWYTHLIRIYNRFRIQVYDRKDESSLNFDKSRNSFSDIFGSKKTFTVRHEGNLISNIRSDKTTVAMTEQWKTRFAVLEDSTLQLYKDRQHLDEKKPLRRRPIYLEGLKIEVQDLTTFFLKPEDPNDERKPIELRCQGATDAATWIEVITKAIKIANSNVVESGGVIIQSSKSPSVKLSKDIEAQSNTIRSPLVREIK